MARVFSHIKIYRAVATTLERISCKRDAIIKNVADTFRLSEEQLSDRSVGGAYNELRSYIGTVINEMERDGLISTDAEGYYFLTEPVPVVIRMERCEKEIVKALAEKNMTKKMLKDRLRYVFGTQKTATHKDDERLYAYIGRIIRRMLSAGVVNLSDGYYSLAPKFSAKITDINEILSLKSDFLQRLHEKGGEFFESYFMTLLKKYYEKGKKEVIECFVTGGSADGGIDGVIKTRDELGFIETTMVQTKNRHEMSSETDVRGFYGAVCAKNGTRGIFATSSDFHIGAARFLDKIDNCIGINGERIFELAIKCGYGIKTSNGKRSIDTKIL